VTVRGAVLAGGKASRYDGQPKGLERVGGERILDRVVAAMKIAVGTPPLLIANAEDAKTWRSDLSITADVRPDCGSLGGLYTAVSAGSEPVLTVAWDMPFVSPDLLKALVDGAGEYDVFLPQSGGRRGVEPLCGVYGPNCGDAIRRSLDDEDFQAIGFHGAVRVGTLPLETVSSFGDPATLFFNVNSAGDLKTAEELWRQLA